MEMLMLRMNTFVELGCSEFREETIPIYTESCHPSLGASTILRRFVLKICHILNWDVLFNTVCISVLYSEFFLVICICCVLAHLTLQHRRADVKLRPTHFLSLSDKVGFSKPLLRRGDRRNCANQTYSIQR